MYPRRVGLRLIVKVFPSLSFKVELVLTIGAKFIYFSHIKPFSDFLVAIQAQLKEVTDFSDRFDYCVSNIKD